MSQLLALLLAMSAIESGHDDTAVGDGGEAVGRLQVRRLVVQDVNAAYGTAYTHADAHHPAKAVALARLYLAHWGREYARQTGRPASPEVLARIWNGGPEGWRKHATVPYWEKVSHVLTNRRDSR